MLEPRTRVPLHYHNGKSLIYGINVGKYPLHHYAGSAVRDEIPGLPLKVNFCGHDEWIKGCYRKRICADEFSIEFMLRGSLRFAQRGHDYRINKGDLFLIHKNLDSEIYAETSQAEKISFSLSGNMLDYILESTGLTQVDAISPCHPELLASLLESALGEIKAKKDGFQTRCSATAYRILLELGRETRNSSYPELVASALKLMDRKIHGQMTINDFCDVLDTSPATLNRAFRKHLNMPPMEYFIRMKMESACLLLRHTMYSIKDIAERTGYSNQLYFSSEFKKRLGVSPKTYRKGEGMAGKAVRRPTPV
ncbi:MAG: AraC family transcriptional regulator [Victivallales bacterium]|nr:AraC family transcriptional regulator [Victivallales bacterium]